MKPSGGHVDDGCVCQGCWGSYRVDVIVPDGLWQQITPKPSAPEGGLLCGSCIMARVEALGRFAAFRLETLT